MEVRASLSRVQRSATHSVLRSPGRAAGNRRRPRRGDRAARSPRRRRRPAGDVTFTKDIAPHPAAQLSGMPSPDGVAPMSLVTYEEARPWARADEGAHRACARQRGAMPPCFVEKNIGIQKFKNDPSLSDEEIATIARWADSGAPRGNRGRPAAAAQLRRHRQVDDRRTGSRAAIEGSRWFRRRARLVGRHRASCRPVSPKIAMRRPSRSARSTTFREPAAPTRSAGATSSIT